MLIKCNDKLYQVARAGDWQLCSPVEVKEYKSVLHRWLGKRISTVGPGNVWDQVLSFMKWSYDETKSEVILHLYYHEERGWFPLVMPQKAHTGMAVDIYEEHPNKGTTMAKLGGTNGDFYMISTVHHHCNGPAFQSGHDRKDELTKEGLHITLGNMGDATFSIDARCSARKEILNAALSDWFEMDPYLQEHVPEDMHEDLLKRRLCKPPAVLEFPEWWKENVIKPAPVTYTPPINQTVAEYWQNHNLLPSHYRDKNHQGHGLTPLNQPLGGGIHQRQTIVSPHAQTGYTRIMYDLQQFELALKQIMLDYSYTTEDLAFVLQDMNVEPYKTIIEEMVNCECKFSDLEYTLSNLADEEKQEAYKAMDKEMDQALAKEQAKEGTTTQTEPANDQCWGD